MYVLQESLSVSMLYVLLLTSLGRNTRSGVSSGLTREGVVVVDMTL